MRSRFDSTDRPRSSLRRANPVAASPYSITTTLGVDNERVHHPRASNASTVSNSRHHRLHAPHQNHHHHSDNDDVDVDEENKTMDSRNQSSGGLLPRSRYSREPRLYATSANKNKSTTNTTMNSNAGNTSTLPSGDALGIQQQQQQHPQRMSQAPVSVLESAILHADSELVATAECAVLEADRSQRELQNWRTTAQQERFALEEAERRKARMEKEIEELERKAARIEEESMRVVPTQSPVNPSEPKHSSFNDVSRFSGSGGGVALTRYAGGAVADAVLPGTFNAYGGAESNASEVMELRYLSSKIISIIEDVEDEVSRQRRKFEDVALQRRLLLDELDRIRTSVSEKKKRRDELTHLKLFVAASLANPVQRQVLDSAHRVEELRREVIAKQRAMCVQRTERASMTKHLLVGAHEKAAEVERATQGLLRNPPSTNGYSNDTVGAEAYHHQLAQTVQELMREHQTFIQTVEMHENEHVALEEYVTVLADRFMNETAARS